MSETSESDRGSPGRPSHPLSYDGLHGHRLRRGQVRRAAIAPRLSVAGRPRWRLYQAQQGAVLRGVQAPATTSSSGVGLPVPETPSRTGSASAPSSPATASRIWYGRIDRGRLPRSPSAPVGAEARRRHGLLRRRGNGDHPECARRTHGDDWNSGQRIVSSRAGLEIAEIGQTIPFSTASLDFPQAATPTGDRLAKSAEERYGFATAS